MNEPLRCLAILQYNEVKKIVHDYVMINYETGVSKYRLLDEKLALEDFAGFDLVMIVTDAITSDLTSRFKNLPIPVSFLLLDYMDDKSVVSDASFMIVRPAQYSGFVKNFNSDRNPKHKEQDALNHARLKIFNSRGHNSVSLERISHLESDGAYTKIYTIDSKVISQSHNIKYYASKLDDNFFRVSNAHIINATHIKDYSTKSEGYIIMPNNIKIKVSRNYKNSLEAIITKYKLIIWPYLFCFISIA